MSHSTTAQLNRIDLIAEDIGRIRRTAEPDSWLWHLADRLAENLESLDVILATPAAELARWYAPRDHSAIKEAIRIVEARRDDLRSKMRTDESRRHVWEFRREKERQLEAAA